MALDDDPTGTQTVHDVWVLTSWEPSGLVKALSAGEPALYILTNSRSLPLSEAQALNQTVAIHLLQAARQVGRPLTVVSRSDSTLRGHYPGEVDALSEALVAEQGTPFDGLCLIPFFAEGERFTIHNIHWVQEGTRLVPAAQTPYARDPAFGYQHSYLPEWVEEKTGGKTRASQVMTISLETLRRGGPQAAADQLRLAYNGRVIIVNAAEERDLEVFTLGLAQVEGEGRRFLFRSAASFVKVAAGINDRPLLTQQELVGGRPPGGSLIVFGSFVPRSSAQLEAARSLPGVTAVELPVPEVIEPGQREPAIEKAADSLNRALQENRDALIFTSREVIQGESQSASLAIGRQVSEALVEVVRRVRHQPRYILGKGGITSSDLATAALNVRAARVLGQVHPGVPVWSLGPGSRWPGVPYIIFPGNVGNPATVAEIISKLRR